MNTVVAESPGIFKVSGSRFVSIIIPVSSKEQIDNRRNEFKKEHASATHICYAYRLAKPETVFSTDAGEPKGTAGRPLLNLLLKNQLTNTAIFVARYYGGKKLGVPGLIDAYTKAGDNALGQAEFLTIIPLRQVEISVPFSRINEVYILAKKHKAEVKVKAYGDPVLLLLTIDENLLESFKRELEKKALFA